MVELPSCEFRVRARDKDYSKYSASAVCCAIPVVSPYWKYVIAEQLSGVARLQKTNDPREMPEHLREEFVMNDKYYPCNLSLSKRQTGLTFTSNAAFDEARH